MRVVALLLFALQIALGFIYGVGSAFDTNPTLYSTAQDNTSTFMYYILPAILAILGWGLIIAYSENSAIAGLVTTLVTVGILVQLGPPVLYFWQNLFNNNWHGRFHVGILL